MENQNECLIIAGDGARVEADMRMLSDASTFFRDILTSPSGHLQKQVIQLPTLDGRMVELLVNIMKGEAYVDLWSNENQDILAAAELVGIVPQRNIDLNEFRIDFFEDQVKYKLK